MRPKGKEERNKLGQQENIYFWKPLGWLLLRIPLPHQPGAAATWHRQSVTHSTISGVPAPLQQLTDRYKEIFLTRWGKICLFNNLLFSKAPVSSRKFFSITFTSESLTKGQIMKSTF